MNDVPTPTGKSLATAEGDLGRLTGQVAAMRAVLVQLLQDVVRADSRLDSDQAAQLVEANERLVVSALGAMTDAETAHGELDDAARAGRLDPLTGLPNRTLLLDRFESAISHAKRHGNRVALLFMDLNAFKEINDTFGHAAGDKALQLVADCLTSLVRETDTVSRHGGDEFLILLAEVARTEDAELVAQKVNAKLGSYSRIDSHVVGLSASIGISVYPDDGADVKTLIERADAAMYLAKVQTAAGSKVHRARPVGQPDWPAQSAESRRRPLTPHELAMAEHEQRHENLREANESLVLAALGAQELLAAAEEVRVRQSELLAMVARELSDPFAPIRLAAATLGIPGAEAALLPKIQAVIEAQADKLAQMVKTALDQQSPAPNPAP
jgi:diguanylate cyclase (GGDEF)-like protein